MFIPLSPNNWAVAASAMNSHTHPAASASNVVNSLWGMQITWFPPVTTIWKFTWRVHNEGVRFEASICDSNFSAHSAMRNPKRSEAMLRSAGPACATQKKPPRSVSCRSACSELREIGNSFHHNAEFKHCTWTRRPACPQDQCCCTRVLPSSVHAKMCRRKSGRKHL